MAGASFGSAWALIWKYIANAGVESRVEDLFLYLGDDHVLAITILLVVAGVVVTGPVERMWKDSFVKKNP